MNLSDKSTMMITKLKQLLQKLTESYQVLIADNKQLRKDLADKAGAEQGRADAKAALDSANAEIAKANARIREIADAGKELCDKAVLAAHRNTAATTFEVAKGLSVLVLIIVNFCYNAQGMICGILWSGMLLWSYIASITSKRERILENVWFLLFTALSCFLLHRYILVQAGIQVDFFLGLFSGGKIQNYAVFSFIMFAEFLMTCWPLWHRKTMDDDETGSKIKAEYAAFSNPPLFQRVEIVPGIGKIDKSSADDDREERYHGHEYLLILRGADALPEGKFKDAKVVCDTRGEDGENAIVVYSVDSLSMLDLMMDWKKKKPCVPDKTSKNSKLNDSQDHPR